MAQLLRELTGRGQTVVATLHQPSAALLGCFTHVLFLADGQVVYHGPVARVRAYFAEAVHGTPMPLDANPADFIRTCVSVCVRVCVPLLTL